MKILILFNIFILFSISYSQIQTIENSSDSKPVWLSNPPPGYMNDYFIGIGQSESSYTEARNLALDDALKRIVESRKLVASTKSKIIQGNIVSIRDELFKSGQSTEINGLKEEESYYQKYIQNDKMFYEYIVLVKIPKENYSGTNPPTKFSYLWRSSLLPGWGQYYKGQEFKGISIFILQLSCITSGYITYNKSVDYSRNAENSIKLSDVEWYNDQSDKYYSISLISWILAGGLYVFNIFDSITSEGKKIYVNNYDPSSINLSINNREIKLLYYLKF